MYRSDSGRSSPRASEALLNPCPLAHVFPLPKATLCLLSGWPLCQRRPAWSCFACKVWVGPGHSWALIVLKERMKEP